MSETRLVGLCGSLRQKSTNRLLLNECVQRFGPADYTEIDIDFPLFNSDLETDGIPEKVLRAAGQIDGADAVIVASPEYNKGITGVLKNALDWISRTDGNPWRDKPVALVSAAAGRAGGERSQNMARLCLTPFRPRLLPGPEVFVGQTSKQWDEDGRLVDDFGKKLIDELMELLRAEVNAARART